MTSRRHSHRFVAFLAALLVGSLLLLCPAATNAAELLAGAAQCDITPSIGFPLWGYAARKDAPCDGIRDPLQARAVVLALGEQRLGIVSLDLGRAPSRASFATISKEARTRARITHLLLVASHTHHGPVLEMEQWPTPEKPYVRQLEQKLIDVLTTAATRLQPARYGLASHMTTLNRNRHSRLPEPPVDREMIVWRLEDLQGKPLAHLVNFAAHPTLLPAKLCKFSADYPGQMAALVEKQIGAPCLFLQGASGDQSPNADRDRSPETVGQSLGKQVLDLAKSIRCNAGRDSTLAIRERDFRFAKRIDISSPLVRALYELAFPRDIVAFYEREYREGVRPRVTSAVLDGKIGIVGVSGEVFAGHALSLKKRARLEHLLFLGYCNDYHQYFPTIEAVAEGGYGADPQMSPVEVGAGEAMMNRALIDLYELRE